MGRSGCFKGSHGVSVLFQGNSRRSLRRFRGFRGMKRNQGLFNGVQGVSCVQDGSKFVLGCLRGDPGYLRGASRGFRGFERSSSWSLGPFQGKPFEGAQEI